MARKIDKSFSRSAAPQISEAEKLFKKLGLAYKKRRDGSLHVPGSLYIMGMKLTSLPDLSRVTIAGDFDCSNNQLVSLAGSPRVVGGDFSCQQNHLTSLKGITQTIGGGIMCYCNGLTSLEFAPQSVIGKFICSTNQLVSLEHAPKHVGGDFWCANNQLVSLEHAPQFVGGDFWCYNNRLVSLAFSPQVVGKDYLCFQNRLTTLEGAPQEIGGAFRCTENKLASLEHAPTVFSLLQSDFGQFTSWAAVPDDLKTSAETKLRQKQERECMEAAIRDAPVLQSSIKVSPRIRLKIKGSASSFRQVDRPVNLS